MTERRSTLEVAIEQRNWELAALCLLNGMVRAAEALPPDAIEELLDLLAGIDEPALRAQRAGRRRGHRA